MSIADRHLADDEQLIYVTRQHWTEMVSEFVILCVIWAVAGVLVWMVSGAGWGAATYVVLGAAGIASVWFWLIPLLKWRSQMYILTTKRIYRRTGFLTKASRAIPLLRVNDVSFKATFWQRIMRYGTISIQSASEQGKMTMRHVPKPEWFKSEIYRAVDEEQSRQQMGPGPMGPGPQWGPPQY